MSANESNPRSAHEIVTETVQASTTDNPTPDQERGQLLSDERLTAPRRLVTEGVWDAVNRSGTPETISAHIETHARAVALGYHPEERSTHIRSTEQLGGLPGCLREAVLVARDGGVADEAIARYLELHADSVRVGLDAPDGDLMDFEDGGTL